MFPEHRFEIPKEWGAGECGDPDDRTKNPPGAMRLAMLIPFAR